MFAKINFAFKFERKLLNYIDMYFILLALGEIEVLYDTSTVCTDSKIVSNNKLISKFINCDSEVQNLSDDLIP